jgi:transcriptional/translational regulatory protein YebC/TACO1
MQRRFISSVKLVVIRHPLFSYQPLRISTIPSVMKMNHHELMIKRNLAVTGRHSKNVAAKKNKLDAAKNKLYTRLGVKILMAAKAGGADTSKNIELARVLREAHSIKLPKENIDRALKKATETSNADYEAGAYEVYGHGGVGIVVSTLTDNSNRANMQIKSTARKAEVKIASGGSVLFQFDHKAIFIPQTSSYDKDLIIEKAIESDMDDVNFLDEVNGIELPNADSDQSK